MKPTSCKSFLSIILLVANAFSLASAADATQIQTRVTRDPELKIISLEGKFLKNPTVGPSETLLCAILPKKAVEDAFAAQEKAEKDVKDKNTDTAKVAGVTTAPVDPPTDAKSGKAPERLAADPPPTSDVSPSVTLPGASDQTPSQAPPGDQSATTTSAPKGPSKESSTATSGQAVSDAGTSAAKNVGSDALSLTPDSKVPAINPPSNSEPAKNGANAPSQTPDINGTSSQISSANQSSTSGQAISNGSTSTKAVSVASHLSNLPGTPASNPGVAPQIVPDLSNASANSIAIPIPDKPADLTASNGTPASDKNGAVPEINTTAPSTPQGSIPSDLSVSTTSKPSDSAVQAAIVGSNPPSDLTNVGSPVRTNNEAAAQTEVPAAKVKEAIDQPITIETAGTVLNAAKIFKNILSIDKPTASPDVQLTQSKIIQ